MKRRKDLTGNKYGRLTVIEDAGKNKHNQVMWKCRCDGGNTITVRADGLTTGHTKSCGCYKSDIHATHRKRNTRLYEIWRSMRKRCGLDTVHNYNDYGGRGITVCPEWRDSFQNFYEWAMDNGYREDLSINRINNDGNYEPSNCTWSTQKEQANNRRSNHVVTVNGETHTVTEWAEITGISRRAIYGRLNRGWSPERALGMKEV